MLSGVAQEIDIETGKLLFSRDSLDHIGFDETHLPVEGGHGTKSKPYDYFHLNTLEDAGDGDLLIGARNTWCMYKVSRKTGEIVWRLNGKKTDFTMGPGSEFYWQHDTRLHGADTLTVFDDGYDGVLPKNEKQSRALILNVDYERMLVTLRKEFIHPGSLILSKAMGNAQMLPGGGMFVGGAPTRTSPSLTPRAGWCSTGSLSRATRHTGPSSATGRVTPTELPAVAARRRSGGAMVYASWNGDRCRLLNVLAGRTRSSLAAVKSAPKKDSRRDRGLGGGPYFAVEPRDAQGRTLSRSQPVKIT